MSDNARSTMLIMTILYLLFMILINSFLLIFGYFYLIQDFQKTKRCLLLLPLNTLIIDNSFNSNLRIIYIQNNLLDSYGVLQLWTPSSRKMSKLANTYILG